MNYQGWYLVRVDGQKEPSLRYLAGDKSYLCDPSDVLEFGDDSNPVLRGPVTQYAEIVPLNVEVEGGVS